MVTLRLARPVTVTGPGFPGFKGRITFYPSEKPGWWWKTGKETIAITPDIVTRKLRRLTLAHNGSSLNVFEHIGAMAYFGLTDVIVESTSWPPHFGCALPMWEQLAPNTVADNSSQVKWCSISAPVHFNYHILRGGRPAYTRIYPADPASPNLRLAVSYCYLPCGYKRLVVDIPNNTALREICSVTSQGISFRRIARVARFLGWPNYRTYTWPGDFSEEVLRHRFLMHRIADIIGALSVLQKDGRLFAGVIDSECSGHEADANCIRQAWKQLIAI